MPYKDMGKKRARDLQWYHDHAERVKPRMRAYTNSSDHRAKQPIEYFTRKNSERRQDLRDFLQQQKMGCVCKRCGNSDFRVLDFHHLDKEGKEGGLGQAVAKNWSKERILREITKCEVLCANCHRILHWEERNGAE